MKVQKVTHHQCYCCSSRNWVSRRGLVYDEIFCIPICFLHEFIHRCLLMYIVDIYESFLQSCFDSVEYFVFYLLWSKPSQVNEYKVHHFFAATFDELLIWKTDKTKQKKLLTKKSKLLLPSTADTIDTAIFRKNKQKIMKCKVKIRFWIE